jgi:DNA-binding transcriptional regulator GbsR (MarR family)
VPALSVDRKVVPDTLTPLEVEMVAFFVRIAQVLGAPKSLGEIYGLLFCSDRPLSLDEITDSLQISRGSASQGLRVLKSLGAIKLVYLPGNRRDHYGAETELRKLTGSLLREQVEPQLEGGEARLNRMSEMLSDEPSESRSFMKARLSKLQGWSRQARRLLPLVRTFLAAS